MGNKGKKLAPYPEGHGSQQKGVARHAKRAGEAAKAQACCDVCAGELPVRRRIHVHGEGTMCYPCWEARWA